MELLYDIGIFYFILPQADPCDALDDLEGCIQPLRSCDSSNYNMLQNEVNKVKVYC